jgi:hypothetical protein
MADIGIAKNWLVSPTKEIDDMWVKVQIQEKRSQIVRYTQDIEDLQKGRILDLQAKIKMCELEILKLENKLAIEIDLNENSQGGQTNG